MTAVELSHREEIERGGQQAEPRGERHRVHVDRVALGHGSECQPRRRLEQQRFAELEHEPVVVGWYLNDL